MAQKYADIIVEKAGQIGIIKFNRPKQLNSFGGNLLLDTIAALRDFNEDPDTVFTVITGEGRFFSSGADIKGPSSTGNMPGQSTTEAGVTKFANAAEHKVFSMARFSPAIELLRSMIDHQKVLVLAMNGPAIGAGAAWFQGCADIFLAVSGAYLQIPFSALGLIPESGSAPMFAQHMGVHRANDFLMFGRQLTVEELEEWGMVNRVLPKDNFHENVKKFLNDQLAVNDGKSMMETKRLQNAPLRESRMIAVYNSMEALAERQVSGAPAKRFAARKAMLEAKSKNKSKI